MTHTLVLTPHGSDKTRCFVFPTAQERNKWRDKLTAMSSQLFPDGRLKPDERKKLMAAEHMKLTQIGLEHLISVALGNKKAADGPAIKLQRSNDQLNRSSDDAPVHSEPVIQEETPDAQVERTTSNTEDAITVEDERVPKEEAKKLIPPAPVDPEGEKQEEKKQQVPETSSEENAIREQHQPELTDQPEEIQAQRKATVRERWLKPCKPSQASEERTEFLSVNRRASSPRLRRSSSAGNTLPFPPYACQ